MHVSTATLAQPFLPSGPHSSTTPWILSPGRGVTSAGLGGFHPGQILHSRRTRLLSVRGGRRKPPEPPICHLEALGHGGCSATLDPTTQNSLELPVVGLQDLGLGSGQCICPPTTTSSAFSPPPFLLPTSPSDPSFTSTAFGTWLVVCLSCSLSPSLYLFLFSASLLLLLCSEGA